MRKIQNSGQYKRDFKRVIKGKYGTSINDLLEHILDDLVADIPLDHKYHDHALTGNWAGCRECHIKPDLLLIYAKPLDDILYLMRLGSHSELGF